ncbi:MAG: hypothetical protein IKJ65_11900 [Clostridia bacterium]|nr:hypothetical protein [Clostridia bacterium]
MKSSNAPTGDIRKIAKTKLQATMPMRPELIKSRMKSSKSGLVAVADIAAAVTAVTSAEIVIVVVTTAAIDSTQKLSAGGESNES